MLHLNKKSFEHDVVFLSGLTRSGKTLLCPIVSSFNNSEKVNLEPNFENLIELAHVNCINEEALIYLLRSQMNLMIYNDAIGRNVNFRPDDYTSVWNYMSPSTYIDRVKKSDGNNVYADIKKSKRLFPLMLHDGLWHAEYIFKAFLSSKIIHIQRHPIDLAYSWINKGYGGAFFEDLRSHIVSYLFNNQVVPYYAFGWEEEYLSLNEADRVIHMINKLINLHVNTYNNLDEKCQEKVLFVNHQELASEPHKVTKNVEVFLGSKITEHTQEVFNRENSPREFNDDDRMNKLQYIQSHSSTAALKLLDNMINEYHNQLRI